MRGITIVLYKKEQIGVDAFNRPIYEKKGEEIADVLIAPAQEQEILDTLNLTGRKAVYTLAIPKGDTHEWETVKWSSLEDDGKQSECRFRGSII